MNVLICPYTSKPDHIGKLTRMQYGQALCENLHASPDRHKVQAGPH